MTTSDSSDSQDCRASPVLLQGPAEQVPRSHRLRIGTVNVATRSGRFTEVMEEAIACGIHVLCMQETRLSPNSIKAAQDMARKRGWQLLCRPAPLDAAGKHTGGLAVLSCVEVDWYSTPVHPGVAHRMQLIRIAAEGHPLLLANVYAHSGNQAAASEVISEGARVTLGGLNPGILIGDFNLTDGQAPVSDLIASGVGRRADDADPTNVEPARRERLFPVAVVLTTP